MSALRMRRMTDPETARLGKSVVHAPAKAVASPRYRDRLATATDWDTATSRTDVTVTTPKGTFVLSPEDQPELRKSARRDRATTGKRTSTAGAARERMHGVSLAQVQAAILSGVPLKGF